MTVPEKEELVSRIKAMSMEEQMVAIDVLPLDLLLDGICKRVQELQTFKDELSKAFKEG